MHCGAVKCSYVLLPELRCLAACILRTRWEGPGEPSLQQCFLIRSCSAHGLALLIQGIIGEKTGPVTLCCMPYAYQLYAKPWYYASINYSTGDY
jgi:hypothetical protein